MSERIYYIAMEKKIFCIPYDVNGCAGIQEVLGAWRTEVDKKPATMSVDDAYKVI